MPPPNLIASLIFGVGQVVIGGWLAWYGLTPRRWREWRAVLAGAAGVWFVVSGVSELIVSGIEVSRLAGGGPDLGVFTAVRAGADTTLFAVTAALVVGLALYFGARLLAAGRGER